MSKGQATARDAQHVSGGREDARSWRGGSIVLCVNVGIDATRLRSRVSWGERRKGAIFFVCDAAQGRFGSSNVGISDCGPAKKMSIGVAAGCQRSCVEMMVQSDEVRPGMSHLC